MSIYHRLFLMTFGCFRSLIGSFFSLLSLHSLVIWFRPHEIGFFANEWRFPFMSWILRTLIPQTYFLICFKVQSFELVNFRDLIRTFYIPRVKNWFGWIEFIFYLKNLESIFLSIFLFRLLIYFIFAKSPLFFHLINLSAQEFFVPIRKFYQI